MEAGEKVDLLEHRILHKSGQVRWVRNTAILRSGEQGKLAEYEGLIQDITDYKHLQEQFVQAQRLEAIGLLAGGVAHDFRNQLTVVKGYAEMLLRGEMVRKDGTEFVQQILEASDRSAKISEQLLAFSRQQILRPEVVNLNRLIDELAKSLPRVLGEDIHLSFELAPDLGNVKLDAGQFQQALMNLVLNARDAMPRGGRLTIETGNFEFDEGFVRRHLGSKPGPQVMIVVSDTGAGMNAETLRHIFEPFFTTKGPGQGTGLGLAMVHGFVKQSGGYVTVYSEVDHGTTFRIYLPRVAETAPTLAKAEAPRELPRGSGTLLVVEDEQPIRQVVAKTLRECGYTVLETATRKRPSPSATATRDRSTCSSPTW